VLVLAIFADDAGAMVTNVKMMTMVVSDCDGIGCICCEGMRCCCIMCTNVYELTVVVVVVVVKVGRLK